MNEKIEPQPVCVLPINAFLKKRTPKLFPKQKIYLHCINR